MPHPLLDQDCKHYLEEMFKAYDCLIENPNNHLEFLAYWFECVQNNPSAPSAMRYAFKYFDCTENKKINSAVAKQAKEYLDDILAYHDELGSFGMSVKRFIKSFQSKEHRESIKTEDFDWFPKKGKKIWTREENRSIAQEFQFAWTTARLWQLLEKRQATIILRNFFSFTCNESQNNSIQEKKQSIPEDLEFSLQNTDSEDISFFNDNLHYFDPSIMTQNQMCNFFKKACISSIKNFPASNAPKQPLDKIWLLGKFYLIHFYPLKFIDSDRGISLRAVKQFEVLTDPQFLNTLCKKSIDEIINKNSIRWGTKGIRIDEVIATLINPRELEDYKQRVLAGKESDSYATALNKGRNVSSENTPLLRRIPYVTDKDNPKLKKAIGMFIDAAQNDPKKYTTLFVILTLLDQIWNTFGFDDDSNENENNDDDFDENDFTGKNISEEKPSTDAENNLNQGAFSFFIAYSLLSNAVKHEKNLILVTLNELDSEFIKKLPLTYTVCFILCTYFGIMKKWKEDQSFLQ